MTRTWTVPVVLALACAALAPGCGNDDARAYDLCRDSADCRDTLDGCSIIDTETTRAGICTNSCGSDLDCPTDRDGERGACLSIGGSAFVCFERCFDDLDCPSTFFCTPTTGGAAETICLPP
jgi:hypothetical protein